MAEEGNLKIEQERLFNPSSKEQENVEVKVKLLEQGKELDFGPKSITLSSGTEVFLKDPDNDEISGYKIPKERKLEIFFLGKINEGDEKTSCTAIDFFRKTEEDEYINDPHILQLEGEVSKYIKRGMSVLCYSKDLIKQLGLGGQKEEQKNKAIEQEKRVAEDLKENHFKKIGENWGPRYRDPTHVKGDEENL